MKKPNSNCKEKLQPVNPDYVEIIELLKSGAKKIKKDLRRTRQVRPCREAQMARELLKETLKLVSGAPIQWHIQILMTTIQNVVYLLEQTRKNFRSKELMCIRESAKNLLEEAKTKYSRVIE
jgi:hypothetical protein